FQHRIFGHDRFLLQFTVGNIPHDLVLRSIELFGTEVALVVRRETATENEKKKPPTTVAPSGGETADVRPNGNLDGPVREEPDRSEDTKQSSHGPSDRADQGSKILSLCTGRRYVHWTNRSAASRRLRDHRE